MKNFGKKSQVGQNYINLGTCGSKASHFLRYSFIVRPRRWDLASPIHFNKSSSTSLDKMVSKKCQFDYLSTKNLWHKKKNLASLITNGPIRIKSIKDYNFNASNIFITRRSKLNESVSLITIVYTLFLSVKMFILVWFLSEKEPLRSFYFK